MNIHKAVISNEVNAEQVVKISSCEIPPAQPKLLKELKEGVNFRALIGYII